LEFHSCETPPEGRDSLTCIPKRKEKFDIHAYPLNANKLERERKYAWGIKAEFVVSLARVLFYHCAFLAGPVVFWVWWQAHHPNDIQTAAVLLTVALGFLSVFWALAGVLPGLHIDQ
jgi:hypothetical protein